MNDSSSRPIVAGGLAVGALFGVAGAFVPSVSLRGVLWGIDGTALVIATALLAVHHLRRGNELAAAGFLVFVAGEALILASSTEDLATTVPAFGAGVGLWSASLTMVSGSTVMPRGVRAIGLVAAVLLAVVAVEIWLGQPLTALTRPLPFFAYPFLAATLCGWAWAHTRPAA